MAGDEHSFRSLVAQASACANHNSTAIPQGL